MIARSAGSMPDRLGPLETQLLRLVWERGHATVRELIDSREVSGAYTTVMTTLDRLYKDAPSATRPGRRETSSAAR